MTVDYEVDKEAQEAGKDEYEVNKDGLQFIFEHTKGAPAKQSTRIDALDAKMTQIFGAASVILGFAALTAVRDAISPLDWGLVAGSLCAYAIVAACAGFVLWPRKWLDNTYASWLWEKNYYRSPDEIRHILVADLKAVTTQNEARLGDKALAIRISLVATAAEVALMVASLVTASV